MENETLINVDELVKVGFTNNQYSCYKHVSETCYIYYQIKRGIFGIAMEQDKEIDTDEELSQDMPHVKYISQVKTLLQLFTGEISMQKGMDEYYKGLKEENKLNHELLASIKKEKGITFYKYLMIIIEESEGIKGLAEIIDKPIGDFQKEKYGRQINGYWVQQWAVGMEGDSWNGFICVQLGDNRFLKFSYSM